MDYYKGKVSISDEVYNEILSKIINEEWKLGEKLPSESKLCSMFGVSRTSVRAALQNLQGSGFVVTMQGVGTFIRRNSLVPEEQSEVVTKSSDISSDEFREFFEFRQAVEFKAIEFFVRRATPEDEMTLYQLYLKMQEAAEVGDKVSFAKYDIEFHMATIRASKNIFLYNAMLSFKDTFFHYMEEIIRLTDKPLSLLAEEHFELYTYLKEKKAKQAKDHLFSDNTYYHCAYFNK